MLDAAVGAVVARAALADSLELKRLLVLGAAGWETKFAVAALEERGWPVDAELRVSPQTTVRQGHVAAIDTSRYSAVLVLDTTAAAYAERIGRYVRSGGGLVLWSPAVDAPRLAALAPGRGRGAVIEDEGRPPSDSAPRQALSIAPITGLVPEAVVLERGGARHACGAPAGGWARGGDGVRQHVALADGGRRRRAGAAPDVACGAGGERGVRGAGGGPGAAEQRGAAGHADRPAGSAARDAMGPERDPNIVAQWVFAALCIALLVEWASRRIRGVK